MWLISCWVIGIFILVFFNFIGFRLGFELVLGMSGSDFVGVDIWVEVEFVGVD